jgi:Arc-like DNA binding domain
MEREQRIMPRTTRGAGGGKRHPLNMRTTKEIRDRLEAAAVANGRSLAQEVEARLERSFAEESGFGGPEMRRVAYLMAAAFATAGTLSASGKPGWVRDRDAYRAGLIGVLDALLIGLPDATPHDAALIIEALNGRLLSRLANEERDFDHIAAGKELEGRVRRSFQKAREELRLERQPREEQDK